MYVIMTKTHVETEARHQHHQLKMTSPKCKNDTEEPSNRKLEGMNAVQVELHTNQNAGNMQLTVKLQLTLNQELYKGKQCV